MDIEQLKVIELIKAMGIDVSVRLREETSDTVVSFLYMGFSLKFIAIDNTEEGVWIEMLPQAPWSRNFEDSRDSMLIDTVAVHFYLFGAAVRFKQTIDSGESIHNLVA